MKSFIKLLESNIEALVRKFREEEINDYLDNDKDDIISYVTDSCHIITNELQKYLTKNGIKSKRVTGMYDGDKHHWWLETTTNIIDVTADQFGDEEVIVIGKNDTRYSK